MRFIKLSILIALISACSSGPDVYTSTIPFEGTYVLKHDLESFDSPIGATVFTFHQDQSFTRRQYCCLDFIFDEDYEGLTYTEESGRYNGLSGNRYVLFMPKSGQETEIRKMKLKANSITILPNGPGIKKRTFQQKKP